MLVEVCCVAFVEFVPVLRRFFCVLRGPEGRYTGLRLAGGVLGGVHCGKIEYGYDMEDIKSCFSFEQDLFSIYFLAVSGGSKQVFFVSAGYYYCVLLLSNGMIFTLSSFTTHYVMYCSVSFL